MTKEDIRAKDPKSVPEPDPAASTPTLYQPSQSGAPAALDGATVIKPDVALNAPPIPKAVAPPRPATQKAASADPQAATPTLFQPELAAKPPPVPLPVGRQVTAVAQAQSAPAASAQPAINSPSLTPLSQDGATIMGVDDKPHTAPQLTPPPLTNSRAPSKSPTDRPEGTHFPTPHEAHTEDPNAPQGQMRPPRPGDVVAHYELIRELGKGGMGSVFLARDNKLGRRVAIKFLHTQHPELTKRFVLEARTTARFSHENIVIIYEVDAWNGQPFMVLEYLQGQPLTKVVQADARGMAPGRVVELMVPVVRALAAAHAQNIVHRDLKFDNVYVTDSGVIKVLDFGIAKVLGGEEKQVKEASQPQSARPISGPTDNTELTRHGTLMGTLAFMSPEQWGKGGNIDHRSDIWAAGIMLFRMIAGKHPLAPLTGMQLAVTGKLDEPMPKLAQVMPSVPAELAAVVDRCLLKKKEDRWPDANSLLRALEPFLPGRGTREFKVDESPYAGLASFQESDADRFFGRNAEIAAVVNRIRDQALMGIIGPSGTGKSSFVRAGVVPALKRSGESWEALVIRPGRKPLQALADIVAPLVSTSASVADDLREQKKLVERLGQEPGYAGAVLRSRARREKRNVLVFVDQFEELYTLVPDPKERATFTACLASIADDATSPTRVVLSIRSDFLDRVPEDQGFMNELTKGLFFLNPPAQGGLRDALVQPAEMAGYRFESADIVDDMLGHLQHTSGALPLLQFTASKLWEGRDATRKLLTKASYDSLGGIAGALASHADATLNEMSPAARALARAIFLRLVTPERTRAIVSMEDLRELSKSGSDVQRLVDQLVQARLLVVQTAGGGVATVEIVHESLIATWPQLRRWLDETGEDAAFLEQLRTAAKQWNQKGREAGLLWRGEIVAEAQRFQRRYKGELGKLQRDFLDAVFAQEARSARRKRALAVGGVSVLVVVAVAAVVALVVIRQAQTAAEHEAVRAKQAQASAETAEQKAKDALAEQLQEERQLKQAKAAEEAAAKRAQELAEEQIQKSQALAAALEEAQKARHMAAAQRLRAMERAAEAARAEKDAQKAAAEAKRYADAEKARADALNKQLGSPVIDTLK